MNARRAARELALLTLFQLDRQGNGTIDPNSVRKDTIRDLTLASVRALTSEAEFQIRSAAEDIAAVSHYLIASELEHDINLETPMDAELKPVPMPNNREMAEKLQRCLRGAEMLHEALRLPEWVTLVRQDDVQAYASTLMALVADHRAALDETLNSHMPEWRMDRLTTMDAYLLRLAAAEMIHMKEVDLGISINEIIDLAKQFSGEESYRLINGILGALADALTAPKDELASVVEAAPQP